LIIGLALSFGVPELRVLQPLFANVITNSATGQTALASPAQIPHFFDAIVTGLVLSGGTEGINSILKFLKYSKESKAAQASDTVADVVAKMAATGSVGAAAPAASRVSLPQGTTDPLTYIKQK